MVISAMSRLARQGGWARILEGKPLEDEIDLVDAALLVEAEVLRRNPDDSLELAQAHPWHYDPEALAAGTLSVLRRALDHAEGRTTGGDAADISLAVAQGLASSSAASVVGESLLPRMPEAHRAFASGNATLLDVGVGIGAFASTLCGIYPGTKAVGLDVLQPVLDLAAAQTATAGLADRVELRLQSVADLRDVDRYDLAWMPQAFIPRAAFAPGLSAIRRALRPNRWLVLLLAAAPSGSDPFERAIQDHGAHLTGGGPVVPEEVAEQLRVVGFDDVSEVSSGEQALLLARHPG